MVMSRGGMVPRRKRPPTLQGGNGRAFTENGVPNPLAQGITQQFLGRNPWQLPTGNVAGRGNAFGVARRDDRGGLPQMPNFAGMPGRRMGTGDNFGGLPGMRPGGSQESPFARFFGRLDRQGLEGRGARDSLRFDERSQTGTGVYGGQGVYGGAGVYGGMGAQGGAGGRPGPGQTPPITRPDQRPGGRAGGGKTFPGREGQSGPGGGGGGRPGGGGQGGGGGGQGGGAGGGGQGGDRYDRLLRRMGLPLDPFFEAQRTQLMNERDMELNNLQNAYDVGQAQLAEQGLLGNRAIDEAMAARGLFGSGIEKTDERLLGNQLATAGLGLEQALATGQLGARQQYRGGMMQAMQELARRLQGEDYLPLPARGRNGGGGGRNRGGNNRDRDRRRRR